jgi:hypothetical protein
VRPRWRSSTRCVQSFPFKPGIDHARDGANDMIDFLN